MIILVTDHANDDQYFGPCLREFESQKLNSIGKFKCWSRGVFQSRICQIQSYQVSRILRETHAFRVRLTISRMVPIFLTHRDPTGEKKK